jgi:predicted dehydrogenase
MKIVQLPEDMNRNILLVGVGRMGQEYARVLQDMKIPFVPVGRGMETSQIFKEKTGVSPVTGGVEKYLDNNGKDLDTAIIAVNVPDLYYQCRNLLKRGFKQILVEKPAALTIDEINALREIAFNEGAIVYVAYNRRFLSSVAEAVKILSDDGGVLSFHFEFTEWSDRVEVFDAEPAEKEKWFLSNSSHVADLAFFIGGRPVEMKSLTSGSLKWHRSASVFSGSGITDKGSLFSYSANWDAPGRWGIELMSRNFRTILRPLEQLHIQKRGTITTERVSIDDALDQKFKPGLYNMVDSFLNGINSGLCTVEEHADIFRYYCQMANYR